MMEEQHPGPDELAAEANWRTTAYLVGAAVGAVVGVGAAYLYINAVEQQDEMPELKPGEAVGIGLAVLALLRQIAGIRAPDDKKKKR